MLRYSQEAKEKARSLRNNPTDAEQRLWSRVRRQQILGIQFYRQRPIGEFIVDFLAPAARLVVEVDGGQHVEAVAVSYDEKRTAYLERHGLRVLRFTNLQVLQELESVVEVIWSVVAERTKRAARC